MKNYLLVLLLAPQLLFPYTIMLDPAGNAKDAGRIIDDSFERGIALQCAEELKRAIEEEFPHVRVVLARSPGEVTEPLHQANFANRLNADLFLSIHLYKETGVKPQCSMYYFVHNRITDFWETELGPLDFIPYDKAHKLSLAKTKLLAQNLFEGLQEFRKLFDLNQPIGIPFKPLLGLTMPALGLELGIKNPQGWRVYIKPLVEGLHQIIQ